jgi:protein-S-isoprenylcysteine O-methyltransferase Ste14
VALYVKAAIFVVATGYFIWLSRRSLRKAQSHGFLRFFAWEAILALVLLNCDHWFDDWLSFRQIVSWSLLAASGYLITFGVLTLYRSGRPGKSRSEETLIGIEKTTKLVTTGIYRFIRHPIYSSAVVGVWGVVLKDISVTGAFLALLSVILLTATAKREEVENLTFFGNDYRRYMERSRMFIPYLF